MTPRRPGTPRSRRKLRPWHADPPRIAAPQRCHGSRLCRLLGRDLLRTIRVVAALDGLSPEQWVHAVITRALAARAYRPVVVALEDDDTPT